MPHANDAERAAARGRITRGRLLFLTCLLMVPKAFAASCGGPSLLLPAPDRAFVVYAKDAGAAEVGLPVR